MFKYGVYSFVFMKWLYSTLAFFLLALAISSFTTQIFLSAIEDSYDDAQQAVKDKTAVFAAEGLKQFYASLDASQRAQVEQLKKLTPEQKQLLLPQQCASVSDSPFCNPKFISGQLSFDDAVKEAAQKSFIESELDALSVLREKFTNYRQYPLMVIGITCLILSFVFFVLADGLFGGMQKLFGNASWLSILSAISFKAMPLVIDRLLDIVSQQAGQAQNIAANILKEVVVAWLTPAMQKGFFTSIGIAIAAGIIWLGLRFFRTHDVTVN
jgi:hypothetical protein